MHKNILPLFLILSLACASSHYYPSQHQSDEDEPAESEVCTIHSCDSRKTTACVTIYQNRNEEGVSQCLRFENIECVNLNPWWVLGGSSRVSSIGSRKSCIRLYDKMGCKGESIDLDHLSEDVNLSKYNFDKRTKSASSCFRGNETEFKKCEENCSGKPACLTLYGGTYFRGEHQCLTFEKDECKPFISYWSIGHFSKVSSVKSHNTCVRVYEGDDCTGMSVDITGEEEDLQKIHGSNMNFRNGHNAKSASSCGRAKSDEEPVKDEVTDEKVNGFHKIMKDDHSKLKGAEAFAAHLESKVGLISGNGFNIFVFLVLIFLLK